MERKGDDATAKLTLFKLAGLVLDGMEQCGEANVPYYLARLERAMALRQVTRDREKKGL